MTRPLEWIVLQPPRDPTAPTRVLGTVWAATRPEAHTLASDRWPARPLHLVATVAWRALSDAERAHLLGLTTPAPPPRRLPPGVTQLDPDTRVTKCRACGKPLRYHKDPKSGKWRRPPQFHAGHCRHVHRHTNHIPRPS